MYYVVKKIECVSSELTNTPVGYLTSIEDVATFNGIHGFPLNDWEALNPESDPCDYFISNNPFYAIDTVDSLPEGIPLTTDLSNPEGA